MKGFVAVLVSAVILTLAILVGYSVTHETIPAGYVGYVYDRTAKPDEDDVIEGTSVINQERTGRIKINPITQEVLTYPTTIVSKNWTCIAEGDNRTDMSMQMATKEGKNIDADVYISVRPIDIGKIIKSFGTKSFDTIVDNDIYGLATLNLPEDIQAKIDQKTEAQNEVELARLEREKQDEVNQQIVDAQKAQSEKELLQRQTEADAKAYEVTKEAEARLTAQQAEVDIAKLEVEQARLEKEAELEAQQALTEDYFRDKELDIQMEAVKAINGSVRTIITSGDGEGFSGLVGIKEILDGIKQD